MKKKIFLTIVMLFMAMSLLVACGEEEQNQETNSEFVESDNTENTENTEDTDATTEEIVSSNTSETKDTEQEEIATTTSESDTNSAAVSNPYNQVKNYSVYIQNEYAHADTDIINLGKNEKVWITIEATPTYVTIDDFYIDYDDTMLEVVDISTQVKGNNLEIEMTIKAKKSGASEVIICSAYDLYEDYENADCYVLTIKGLDSKDGKVVYVSSTGEKYHFSSSCINGGIKTTLYDALLYEYEPCGKCAK